MILRGRYDKSKRPMISHNALGPSSIVVAIAVFLASKESRMLTGTVISTDGGRSSYLKISAPQD